MIMPWPCSLTSNDWVTVRDERTLSELHIGAAQSVADAKRLQQQLATDPRHTPLQRLRNEALAYLMLKTGLRESRAVGRAGAVLAVICAWEGASHGV